MPKYYSVHPQYIQRVQLAWTRQPGEFDLAAERGVSAHTVNHFLKGQPIEELKFLDICQILGLDWQEIAGLNQPENLLVEEGEVSEVITYPEPTDTVSTVDRALHDLVKTLCEMLSRITRKAGNLLRADRTSIFLLDRERQELGSLIAEDGGGGCLMIDLPANKGIASLAATSLKAINIPFDVYDDPRSEVAKGIDKKTGYRTYTILAWPLLNDQKDLVAVVQLINKLKPNYNPEDDLSLRIDTYGFTSEDEARFAKFTPSILKILERCQFCYQLAQKLKKNPDTPHSSAAFKEADLLAQLQRQEQQLRQILERI